MRFFLLLLTFFITNNSFSQKADTIINNGFYKSYFSYAYKQPLFVIYTLYKGGGSCNRKGLNFKSNGVKNSATAADYLKSGYDQGHLANYEDYSYDCKKSESTFRFCNALPQTRNLNRGIWKVYESVIRDLSQTDSLLIITGGGSYHKKSKLYVPDFCWKVVYSLSKKKIMYVLYFTNDNNAVATDEKITVLEAKLGYSIQKYLN